MTRKQRVRGRILANKALRSVPGHKRQLLQLRGEVQRAVYAVLIGTEPTADKVKAAALEVFSRAALDEAWEGANV